MTNEPATIRVFIPLTFKRRKGRPKILPPENVEALTARKQDPHVLRAMGRAWGWRRKSERGEVATLSEIAKAESVTFSFVSRYVRLAYLAPEVLHSRVVDRRVCVLSLDSVIGTVALGWAEQMNVVTDGGS
jgi:hypothetical protein